MDCHNAKENMEEDVFEIDKILDTYVEENKRSYFVRWKGYGENDDTWEPEDNLDGCEDVLKVFWKSSKKPKPKKARKRKRETLKQQTKGKQSKDNFPEDNNNQPASNENNDYIKDNEEEQKKLIEDFVGTLGEIGTSNETSAPENETNGRIGENVGYVEYVSGSANEILLDSLHPNVLPAGTTETAPASEGQSIGSEEDANEEILNEPCGELKHKSGPEDSCIASDGHSESPKLCEETLADTSCGNSCDQTEAPASSGTHAEEVGECLTAKNEECRAITPRNDCEMLSKEAPLQVVKTTTDCAGGNGISREDIPCEVNCKRDNFEEEKIIRPSVPSTNAKGLVCTEIENTPQSHQILDQDSLSKIEDSSSKIEPSRCELKEDNLGLNESNSVVIDREHDQAGDGTVEKEEVSLAPVLGNTQSALATILENTPSCVSDQLENEGQMNELLNQKEEDMSISSSDNFEDDNEIGFGEQDKINIVMLDQFENNNVPEPSKPEISKIFGNLLKMKKKINTLKPLSKETSDEIHQRFLLTNNYCLPPINQSNLPKHTGEGDPGLLGGTANSHETELNENSSHPLPVVENSSSEEFAIEKLRFPQSLIPLLDKSCFPGEKEYANPSPIYQGSMKENCDSSPSPVSEKYSSKDNEEKYILPDPLPAVENFAQDVGHFPQENIKNSSADIYKIGVSNSTSPTYFEVAASTSSSSAVSEQRFSEDLGGNSDIQRPNKQLSVISISDDSESTDSELEENKRKQRSKSSKNVHKKHSYYKGKKYKRTSTFSATSGQKKVKKHSKKKAESESSLAASNYCDVVSEIIKSSSLNAYDIDGRESETSHGKNKRHSNSDMEFSDSDFEFDLDDYNPAELETEKAPKAKIDKPTLVGIPSGISLGDVKKAIRRGNSSTVLASLAGGLDIESPDGVAGMTLLMRAVSTCQDGIVQLLIGRGANVNALDNTGNTPLMLACEQGFSSIAVLLLNAEADVNAKQSNGGETALIKACKKGLYPLVCLLVSYGADCQMRGQSGLTASQWAAQCGHFEICDLLTAHNKRLLNCIETAIINCLGHMRYLIFPPLLPYVCLYPNEGQTFTFHFNCCNLLLDKTILLFCFRAVFSRTGDVNVSFSKDNGIQSISCNGLLQTPILKNNRSVFKLHPKVDTNRLILQTYNSRVHLLVCIYAAKLTSEFLIMEQNSVTV